MSSILLRLHFADAAAPAAGDAAAAVLGAAAAAAVFVALVEAEGHALGGEAVGEQLGQGGHLKSNLNEYFVKKSSLNKEGKTSNE